MASGTTVDYSHIFEVCGNDAGFVFNLLSVITKGLAEYPRRLEMARQDQKWDEIREIAHKFKSSIAYLYHQEMDELLDDIEMSAEKGTSPQDIYKLIDRALVLVELIKSDVDQKIKEMR